MLPSLCRRERKQHRSRPGTLPRAADESKSSTQVGANAQERCPGPPASARASRARRVREKEVRRRKEVLQEGEVPPELGRAVFAELLLADETNPYLLLQNLDKPRYQSIYYLLHLM